MKDIQGAVNEAIKIAEDDSHGYDQEYRNGPDYDCSSFISKVLHDNGFNVSEDSWTGNLYEQLTKNGFKEVSSAKDRKAGDIFLTPNHHVVMCINSKEIVHASGNEKGKATGGKEGDQTGKEICIRSFYTPSYGWKYHLRYDEEKKDETNHDNYATYDYPCPKLIADIIEGKYGVYPERKDYMEDMGLDYSTIQFLVNETLKGL